MWANISCLNQNVCDSEITDLFSMFFIYSLFFQKGKSPKRRQNTLFKNNRKEIRLT